MGEHRNQAVEWLSREDEITRHDRLARLEWIADALPQAEYLSFPGGMLSKYHYEEMRYCFVYGQFLAAILLGLAYIERIIAASFYGAGRNDLERANISTLLREALASGMIARNELAEIDHARETRNAFTHFRRPLHEESIEHRAMIEKDFPYEVIERDARHVIEAAFKIVARNAV